MRARVPACEDAPISSAGEGAEGAVPPVVVFLVFWLKVALRAYDLMMGSRVRFRGERNFCIS